MIARKPLLQETAKLRPRMSTTVKMLTNENDIKDIEISQPGLLSDLMDIRLRQKHSYQRTQTKISSIFYLVILVL
ncbi:hypothetical protein NC652_036642 [Populus alba x Populus x berolinensis]|nr:hypothetical protein NC652_036642 [Populus alba x Populus x berolinensis]